MRGRPSGKIEQPMEMLKPSMPEALMLCVEWSMGRAGGLKYLFFGAGGEEAGSLMQWLLRHYSGSAQSSG